MIKFLVRPAFIGFVALGVTGCGNTSDTKSGLSTASILGEAPAGATGDRPGITRDDPMAQPVQVAWTSARAQKCGFNFDPVKLKANYMAAEQRGGADAGRMGQIEKTYDMTVTKIKGTIASADTYCTDRQSQIIKADLNRHLAGDYSASFPEDKKVAEGNFFSKATDQTNHDKFSRDSFWRDYEDKKNGVKTQ
jgi:hypothetical protein